jgi:N6-L-threonylcarbamoyladenine synthase
VVGVSIAKAIAEARSLPIAGIHHLEGHIYGAAVGEALPFPALALIASGGHSHLVIMRDHGRYQVIGRTRDDAAGEAFEKGARLLGFPYPGSPQLADLADSYRGRVRPMPRARIANSWDFSFSGVKTELARRVRQAAPTGEERVKLAAGYQESIDLSLVERATRAAEEFGGLPIVLVGGVARNRRLREMMAEKASALGLSVRVPDPRLCTDNAAMIAAAGIYKLTIAGPDGASLDVAAGLALREWRSLAGAAS